MTMSKSHYDILIRPVITERALVSKADNKYTFQVALDANKHEIKNAVEHAFGVTVVSVNTVITKGKEVRRVRMRPGRKSTVKKAVVTLAPGQALEY